MTRLPLAVLLVTSALIAGACDSTSPFERSNSSDPKSDVFTPHAPSELSISAEDGVVTLTLPDRSRHGDGHLVEKSLGDSTSFDSLATLPPDAFTYRDTTRHFARPTYYRVRTFADRDGERNYSNEQTAKVPLGHIEALTIDARNGEAFHVSWMDSTALERAFRVEVSVDGQPFREVTTLPPDRTSYIHRPEALSFAETRTYRVIAPLLGADTTAIDRATSGIEAHTAFAPSDLTANLRDEVTVQLAWKDRSGFETGFAIYANDSLLTESNSDTEQLEVSVSFQNNSEPRLCIRAVDASGAESACARKEIHFSISRPTLRLQPSDDPSRIHIAWTHHDPLTKNYIVERSPPGSHPSDSIATLSADTRSYTDASVQSDQTYRYRVRTLASDPSRPLRVAYLQHYERVYTVARACGQSLDDLRNTDPPPYLSFRMFTLAHALAVDASGSRAAAGWGTDIALFDPDTGQITGCLSGHQNQVSAVAFSPNGTYLAAGADGIDGDVRIWELPAQTLFHADTDASATDLAFRPDGTQVAAVGGLGGVWAWHVTDGTLVFNYDLTSATTTFRSLTYRPNGAVLLTSSDLDIRFFNPDNGELISEQSVCCYPHSFSFNPRDDRQLLYAEGGSTYWRNLSTGARRRFGGTLIRYDPEGTRFATLSDREGIVVYDADTFQPIGRVITRNNSAFAFHPDGRHLLTWTEGLVLWEPSQHRWTGL